MKFYWFIRLHQTGDEWNQNLIGFTFFKLYGKLQDKNLRLSK